MLLRGVSVVGPPASGKSSICRFVIEHFPQFVYVPCGELVLSEIRSGSEAGRRFEAAAVEGRMIPDDDFMKVMENYLSNFDYTRPLLVDGSPRNMVQAELWPDYVDMLVLVEIECDRELSLQRQVARRKARSDRPDTSLTAIVRRVNEYPILTKPVVSHYIRSGVPVRRFDSAWPRSVVFSEVKQYFSQVVEQYDL